MKTCEQSSDIYIKVIISKIVKEKLMFFVKHRILP